MVKDARHQGFCQLVKIVFSKLALKLKGLFGVASQSIKMKNLRQNLNLVWLVVIVLLFLDFISFQPINQVAAAINPEINWQAKITDTSNVAIANGTYSIVFSLYTTATGGSAVWTETNSVTATSGLVSVLLGQTTSLTTVNFNQTLYLGVNIAGDGEMTPRKKLGAVPAAFESSKLEGFGSAQFLRSDAVNSTSTSSTFITLTQTGAGRILDLIGSNQTVFSALSSGNVGIGSTTPFAKLSVHGNIGETNAVLFEVGSSTVSATSTLFQISNRGIITVRGSGANVLRLGEHSDNSEYSSIWLNGATGGNNYNFTSGVTDQNLYINVPLDKSISFFQGDIFENLQITTSGNVRVFNNLLVNNLGGFGTSTPQWQLQVAHSSAPQLALTDGSTNNHWTFRNAGGQLYFATSSPMTFATSTVSVFSIDVNGIPSFPSLGSGLILSTGGIFGSYGGTNCTSQFIRLLSISGVATCESVSLTNDITGTLPVANGGTGATTLTGLLQGNGTNAFTAITDSSTAGQTLRVTGASTYAWGALDLGNTNAITGDLPFSNLTQITGLSVLGVTGASTADVAAIAAGSDHQVLRRSGSGLAFGAVNLAQSAAVTGILGVANGGTGQSTVTTGDLLYGSATDVWSKLSSVAAGSYLRSTGVGAAPVWSTLTLPNSATANQVVYATASNAWGGSANFTFNGTDVTMAGDLAINGGDLTSTATTFNAWNTVQTLNLLGNTASGVAGVVIGPTTGTSESRLVIQGPAGSVRRIFFNTGSTGRWGLLTNSDAETGSDAGSSFLLQAHNDAGSAIDSPISIVRASGGLITIGGSSNRNVTFNGDIAVNGGDLTSTATSFNLLNSNVTTLNLGGALGTLNIGGATPTVSIGNTTPTFRIRIASNSSFIENANTQHMHFNTAGTTRLTVQAGGNIEVINNLGVGSTTPFAKLAVNPVAGDANQFVVGSSTATSFIITNAGNVGIGGAAPSYRLDAQTSASSDFVARILNTSTANTADGLIIQLGVAASSRSSGNVFIGFAAGTGAPTFAGKIYGAANAVVYDTTATDFAEYFRILKEDDKPQTGELVAFDPDSSVKAVKRAEAGLTLVGVVSTRPGFVGGGPVCPVSNLEECEAEFQKNHILIGMTGQVPVKVNGEGGPIKPGDYITISSVAGIGQKAVASGMVVGIAAESFSGSTKNDQGEITMLINLGYVNIKSPNKISQTVASGDINAGLWSVDPDSGIILANGSINLRGNFLTNVKSISSASGLWSISESGVIIAQELRTKRLTAESGVTTRDRASGNYYCIFVEHGVISSAPGKCGEGERATDHSNPDNSNKSSLAPAAATEEPKTDKSNNSNDNSDNTRSADESNTDKSGDDPIIDKSLEIISELELPTESAPESASEPAPESSPAS